MLTDRAEGLCSDCAEEVRLAAEYEREDNKLKDYQYWHKFVDRHDLHTSWYGEGLGLLPKWRRGSHLGQQAFRRYLEYRSWGMSQYMAAAKATGVFWRRNPSEKVETRGSQDS